MVLELTNVSGIPRSLLRIAFSRSLFALGLRQKAFSIGLIVYSVNSSIDNKS